MRHWTWGFRCKTFGNAGSGLLDIYGSVMNTDSQPFIERKPRSWPFRRDWDKASPLPREPSVSDHWLAEKRGIQIWRSEWLSHKPSMRLTDLRTLAHHLYGANIKKDLTTQIKSCSYEWCERCNSVWRKEQASILSWLTGWGGITCRRPGHGVHHVGECTAGVVHQVKVVLHLQQHDQGRHHLHYGLVKYACKRYRTLLVKQCCGSVDISSGSGILN